MSVNCASSKSLPKFRLSDCHIAYVHSFRVYPVARLNASPSSCFLFHFPFIVFPVAWSRCRNWYF